MYSNATVCTGPEVVYLVRVLDMHAETGFFQEATFSLDDLVLEVDVVLVEHQRVHVPATHNAVCHHHTPTPQSTPTGHLQGWTVPPEMTIFEIMKHS